MRKRTVLLLSITLALLLVGIGAGGGEGESPPPVLVPVILDGVRYEPEEFNRIERELHSKGVDLIYTLDPQNGDFLAFTTEEGYNEWATKHGLRPAPERPTGGRVGRVVKEGNVTYVFPR